MASLNAKQLTVNGIIYAVRYMTETKVVCDTDELQGEFGDEYPLKDVKAVK